ncbi:hypothetical protein FRC08_010139, partial [Ceratobasidium sp. 394]
VFPDAAPNILKCMRSGEDDRPEWELCLHEVNRSTVEKDIRTHLAHLLEDLNLPAANIDNLVRQSGELFLYADMLADYARHGSLSGGTGRLERLLDTLTPSEINVWYTTILEGILDDSALEERRKAQITLALRTVVCARKPKAVNDIAETVVIDPADLVQDIIHPLWSILRVSDDGLVTALHGSFPNYLIDRRRSGRFSCEGHYNAGMTLSCFDLIKDSSPPFNICNLESSYLHDREIPNIEERLNQAISEELLHACRSWETYFELADLSEEVLDAFIDMVIPRALIAPGFQAILEPGCEAALIMGVILRETRGEYEFPAVLERRATN